MKIKFRTLLTRLDYDSLNAEMSYLKENCNVNYTLTRDKLIFNCVDSDYIDLIKDSLKLFYGDYLKRGAI